MDELVEAVAHEDNIGGLDGNVRASSHGDADVGGGDRGGIVDTVADHADPVPGFLKFTDDPHLVLRQ